MLGRISLALCLGLVACDTIEPPAAPPPPVSYSQTVNYNTNVFSGGQRAVVDTTSAAGVLILQSTKLDRPAEVVGVVDVHEPMPSEDAALAKLREKAAAMGANAVVGVEFHHGEGAGEPTHLSGLAVRFRPTLADVSN